MQGAEVLYYKKNVSNAKSLTRIIHNTPSAKDNSRNNYNT